MRLTVGGDAEHYTFGANAAFSAAVSTCATLHDSARVMLAFVFFLHVFGRLLPIVEHLLQFAEILQSTALTIDRASGDQPV